MRILLIGSGGREHALAWKISQSPRLTALYASPGSDAISELAICVALEGNKAIADFAEKEKIDLTVVGPEAPLVEGLVDELQSRGLLAFGPTQAAAQLEGSKAFSKEFMRRHNIPTAGFHTFDSEEQALAHVQANPGPCVVKADGLAAGKGVILCEDGPQAEQAIQSIMVDHAFGEAGTRIVVEEWLRGEEASYFAVCDGKDYIAFPTAQDHKPIGELDTGLNTGGMGAYCPAPIVTEEMAQQVRREVVETTLRGMAAEGNPYQGVLYVGLMIVNGVPYVLEYNCRFGDPECQPLMMMLESDLLEILEAAAKGAISGVSPHWRKGAAACIVMASGGYPGAYPKGIPIQGLTPKGGAQTASKPEKDCKVFHAGTSRKDQDWVTNGGRVLGITAWGKNLSQALTTGYNTLAGINWNEAAYRRDIGLKGLKRMAENRPDINVGIVLGSASDMEVADKVTSHLEKLGIRYELAVASAHRTPERVRKFISACTDGGAEVFIAIAGMAAALPGVVAAETTLPVIGVPVKSSAFEGLDALLSIAQMPPGIPVATVAVNGGVNAALLAASILSVKYQDVSANLKEFRIEQAQKIAEAHTKAGLSSLV